MNSQARSAVRLERALFRFVLMITNELEGPGQRNERTNIMSSNAIAQLPYKPLAIACSAAFLAPFAIAAAYRPTTKS